MNIYIIAGEKSGDFIGSKVIKALKSLCADKQESLILQGVGGDLMQAEGLRSLFPVEQINIMGFLEILPHIFRIKGLIENTIDDIVRKKPQILVTIDSPGFTFRVAKQVRKKVPSTKLVHIVAPSVWAYKAGRAKKYAKIYDHLLTLLPFEPEYFTKEGLEADFIGHPVLEQNFYPNSRDDVSAGGEKVIAITPGSRMGEIKRHTPIIREALDILATNHKIKAVFVQSDEKNINLINEFLINAKFKHNFSTDRLKAFAMSDCALAKSGTNTLEIAASGTPMIIGYKLNPVTFFIIKMLIKVKFACLINIIAKKEIIPEYIQNDFNADNIALAINKLLIDSKLAKKQITQTKEILKIIGFGKNYSPSERAAKIIFNLAK